MFYGLFLQANHLSKYTVDFINYPVTMYVYIGVTKSETLSNRYYYVTLFF